MAELGHRERGTSTAGSGSDEVWAGIERLLADRGPIFLASRRWFGDKARRIVSIEPIDSVIVPVGLDLFIPTIARVWFADGGQERYFVPLVITAAPVDDGGALGTITGADGTRVVAEAIAVEPFRDWLLDRLVSHVSVPMLYGTLTFTPTSVLEDYVAAARSGPSRMVSGEQSNSSIVYGDTAILKAFRKLRSGTNPDIEIGRFLTDETGFTHAPPLLGAIEYAGDDGDIVSIAVLQLFIPSSGDAWTALLDDLGELVRTPDPLRGESVERLTAGAALLGRRTGDLHVALASATTGHAMAPETITAADVAAWAATLAREVERFLAEEDERSPARPGQPDTSRPNLGISSAATGYQGLVGSAKIRVHGDYHLGQVLHTLTGDVVILDFEGEPSRPVEERRRKTSPLKDVAGMLRSFTYARVATARSVSAGDASGAEAALRSWEDAARHAFIGAYRDTTASSPVPLYPTDTPVFDRALRAWEVEKAIYEVGYERNNRPDWLHHVLATLDRLSAPEETSPAG